MQNQLLLRIEYRNYTSYKLTGNKWWLKHIFQTFVYLSNFRFSPTRPPIHWSGIRTAFAHGPVCPQSLPAEAVEPEAAALKKVRCVSCDNVDQNQFLLFNV